MTTAAPPWTWKQVFGDPDEGHRCCDCCDGGCAALEPSTPMLIDLKGEWITDRYVAIRRDLIALPDTLQVMPGGNLGKSLPAAPATEPPESDDFFLPSSAARLLNLGLDIRQGPDVSQHLYRNGEHVGWYAAARSGRPGVVTLNQVRGLIKLSHRLAPTSATQELVNRLNMPELDALALAVLAASAAADIVDLQIARATKGGA